MKQYDFDEIIPRAGTNSINYEGYEGWLLPADEKLPWSREQIIRLWVADMDFAVPDVVLDAIRQRLDQRILGYTGLFDPGYFEAFAAWTKSRYDWSFPAHHLVTSPGIVPALFTLPDLIMAPDEKILILTPSYAPFQGAGDRTGREVVWSRLLNRDGHFTMDFADLREKAADPKTTLCIFCNPHNPTGRAWSREELETFAGIMKQEKMWVISDEIHCDLLRTGGRHIPLAKVMTGYDRLVTAMAPTKTFNLAGLMISNLIIPDDRLREAWKQRSFGSENPLSIAGAQAAYREGGPWLAQLQTYLDDNFIFLRQYLQEHLPKAVFRIPEATYLAWVDLSAYRSGDVPLSAQDFARRAGVILEGEDQFVDNGRGFVRLNLACPRSVLAEGLDRITAAVRRPDETASPEGVLKKLRRRIRRLFGRN